jgi:glutamate dehydrogenase/leucine dehydrogenase
VVVKVPDPLVHGAPSNAAGVTVSYYEWVQNIENEQWDEDEDAQREVNFVLRVSGP